MENILDVLVEKGHDLDKEIIISAWDTMHQAEASVGKVSKRDLIKRIIETEDVLFIQGIFWDD